MAAPVTPARRPPKDVLPSLVGGAWTVAAAESISRNEVGDSAVTGSAARIIGFGIGGVY
jgi:hypothetical protein